MDPVKNSYWKVRKLACIALELVIGLPQRELLRLSAGFAASSPGRAAEIFKRMGGDLGVVSSDACHTKRKGASGGE